MSKRPPMTARIEFAERDDPQAMGKVVAALRGLIVAHRAHVGCACLAAIGAAVVPIARVWSRLPGLGTPMPCLVIRPLPVPVRTMRVAPTWVTAIGLWRAGHTWEAYFAARSARNGGGRRP